MKKEITKPYAAAAFEIFQLYGVYCALALQQRLKIQRRSDIIIAVEDTLYEDSNFNENNI